MSETRETNYKGVFDSRLGFGTRPCVLVIDFIEAYTTKGAPFFGQGVVDAVDATVGLLSAARSAKVPIIYTDINFHREVLEGVHFDNPFWLRSTAAEPHQRYSNRQWTLWQWTQTGTMSGINTEVDRNSFYGDENAWTAFMLTGCDPRTINQLAPQGRCQSLK